MTDPRTTELDALRARWEYIKTDIKGARSLLRLLRDGHGTPYDFDTVVDRVIESRKGVGLDQDKQPQDTQIEELHRKFRQTATTEHHDPGTLEIDSNATVSIEEGPSFLGAYVQAWVWIDAKAAGLEVCFGCDRTHKQLKPCNCGNSYCPTCMKEHPCTP